MNCPRCGSLALWNESLWWGCKHCGFACHGTQAATFLHAKDLPGLARNLDDMKQRGQWPLLDY